MGYKRKYGGKHHSRGKRARRGSNKRLIGPRASSGGTPKRVRITTENKGHSFGFSGFTYGKYKIPGFSYSNGGGKVTKEIEASGQHNDMDKVSSSVILHPPKKFFREFGVFKLTFSRSWTFSSVKDGLQGVGDGYSILSTDQCANTAIASGTALALYQNRNNYFDYNPSQATTGGTAPGLAAVGTPSPDKLVVKNINYEMNVYNATSCSAEVEVLFCLCKRDTVNTPVGSWDSAMTREALAQPVATQPTSAAAASVNTWVEGAGSSAQYGSMPTYYAEFKNFWKVIKSYKFILPSGDTHRIKTHFAINKIINKAYAMTAKTNGNLFLKGYSISPIIISRGAIVKHADSAAAADQQFTYGYSKLGIVSTVTHELASLGAGRITYQRFGAGIVSNTNFSTVDSIINDVDQVVNPVTN
mgnify:FL=1